MPERPPQLAHLEFLGDATKFAGQIQALIPKCTLLEHFSLGEVSTLAHFMDMYRAETGMEIIRERDGSACSACSMSSRPWARRRIFCNARHAAAVAPLRLPGRAPKASRDAAGQHRLPLQPELRALPRQRRPAAHRDDVARGDRGGGGFP